MKLKKFKYFYLFFAVLSLAFVSQSYGMNYQSKELHYSFDIPSDWEEISKQVLKMNFEELESEYKKIKMNLEAEPQHSAECYLVRNKLETDRTSGWKDKVIDTAASSIVTILAIGIFVLIIYLIRKMTGENNEQKFKNREDYEKWKAQKNKENKEKQESLNAAKLEQANPAASQEQPTKQPEVPAEKELDALSDSDLPIDDNKADLKNKLGRLEEIFKEGIISEQEYKTKKEKLLEEFLSN